MNIVIVLDFVLCFIRSTFYLGKVILLMSLLTHSPSLLILM